MITKNNSFYALLKRLCEMRERIVLITMGCAPTVGTLQQIESDHVWLTSDTGAKLYVPLALVAGIEVLDSINTKEKTNENL